MTRLLMIACALASLLGVAHAMNWEGHDDWMADLPAAKRLESAGENVERPLKPPERRRPCLDRENVGQVQPNPYDNVLPLCPERRRPAK